MAGALRDQAETVICSGGGFFFQYIDGHHTEFINRLFDKCIWEERP